MKPQLQGCPLGDAGTSDLLLDYAAGRLDATSAATLERHMNSCDRCATFRGSQTAVWDALDAWQAPPVSADFNRRLWQRIAAAEAQPWYSRLRGAFWFAHWKTAVPLAAAAMVIVAGFLLDHPGARLAPASSVSTPSVSVTEADQLEQTLDDVQLLNQLDATAGTEKTATKPL